MPFFGKFGKYPPRAKTVQLGPQLPAAWSSWSGLQQWFLFAAPRLFFFIGVASRWPVLRVFLAFQPPPARKGKGAALSVLSVLNILEEK